ncbi:MAG TPA: hypothetical protein VFC76_00705 [Oscillospiraceae bacterium]|nr:hypothetical protein [Oscillospiraceae bacterium]
MKLSKLSLDNLFSNDKFVLVFSIVVSIVIWVLIAINVSPETERVVQNVKVVVETKNSVPSQLGLKVFGETDFYVDVTVVGKKYLVSQSSLSADDISVSAVTEYVNTAGVHRLDLKATAKQDNDFEIVGMSKQSVEVYFDVEKTQEFSIKPEIITEGDFPLTEKGFKIGTPLLSVSTITVKGPATEISKIASVVARASVGSTLLSSTTLDSEFLILDENNKQSFQYLSADLTGDISMRVPVYGVKRLPVDITFKNATSYYLSLPLKYTLTPDTDNFDVSIEEYETTKSAIVGSVDFKDISVNNNTFSFPAENLTEIAYSGKVKSFSVKIDMTNMEQRTFTVPTKNIKIINNTTKAPVTLVSGLNSKVTIVGPSETIELLKASDIFADVDLKSEEIEQGVTAFEARVYTSNTTCWAYGRYTCDIKN